MSKFASRKLIVTVLIVLLVAAADILGAQLEDKTIEAILTMGLGLVGGQSLVDVAHAIRTGRDLAAQAEDLGGQIDE